MEKELKDNLFQQLENIIDEIKGINKNPISFILGSRLKEINENCDECIELQKQIRICNENNELIYELKKKVVAIENTISRRIRFITFALTTILLYVLLSLLGIVISSYDFTSIFKYFNLNTSPSSIFFGISGGLIYFATSALSEMEKEIFINKAITAMLSIHIRLFLAVIVPIVVISLLFSEGNIKDRNYITPEFFSFICGYSLNLVVNLLEKLVEKGRKIIETL